MRLRTADFRHPAERLTLLAAAWLALTLLLLVEFALIALIAVRPVNSILAVTAGSALLLVFNGGLVLGLLRIEGWLNDLKNAARRAGPTRHKRVHEAFECAAERLSVPATPPIYVMPTDDLDCFSISWGVPATFVSEGLVERLSDLELRAALGHELGHLKAGHSRLRTMALLPLRAQLLHITLLAPFALAWLALRWWAAVAELSADRAAAIAAGGPEPVAYWLSSTAARAHGAPRLDLHRYLTETTDEAGWKLAQEELHLARPEVAKRIIEVARFTDSRRFNACLAIAGDLKIPVVEMPRNPGSAGIVPHVAIGMLAGIWLAPLTLGLLIALESSPHAERSPDLVPEIEAFSPDALAEEEPAESRETPAATAREAAATQVDAMLGLARSYKNEGNLAQARAVLEELLLADPANAEGHYLLAWVHVDMDNRSLARGEFIATMNLAEPGSEMHREATAALERMR